jgi:hypothetical protein
MENILSKLKFISKLEPGDKIDTSSVYKLPPSFRTSIYRTFTFDSRKTTLNFVSSTINDAFDLLSLSKSNGKDIFEHIVNDIQSARDGLLNLKQTYPNDIKFQCDIETIINMIDVKLKAFE